MSAQVYQDLKEPLISDGTKQVFTHGLLNSYLRKNFGSRYGNHYKSEAIANEENNENNDEAQSDHKSGVQKNDFIFSQSEEVQEHLVDFKEEYDQEAKSENKDYYLKSTAVHRIPDMIVNDLSILKTNPNIFATLSTSSKLFKDIELKEFMQLKDFKMLTRIRIRNYIYILRTLTKVDTSEETYTEIRKRLYQIKALANYLDLLSITEYQKLYERLDKKNHNLYDLDEDEEEKKEEQTAADDAVHLDTNEERSHKSEAAEEGEPAHDEQQDYGYEAPAEDEEYEQIDYNDEDYQLREFFKSSSTINNDYSSYYSQELEVEELKWQKRIEWLEEIIEKFKTQSHTQKWVAWFQAKLDQLEDLDVQVKSTEKKSNHVLYIKDFLADIVNEQEKKKNPDLQEYHKDFKVYVDEENLYPKVNFQKTYFNNETSANFKQKHNLREKFCLKIARKERDTEQILTVFERKALGNEKLYEKRLNFSSGNGKTPEMKMKKMEFHPNGEYLYLKLSQSVRVSKLKTQEELEDYVNDVRQYQNEGDKEYTLEDISEENKYSHDYTEIEIDLVFPLKAPHKNPLLLKPKSQLICFQDKYIFTGESITKKIKKQAAKDKKGGHTNDGALAAEDEENKKDEAGNEDQDSDDYEDVTFVRIFEYDLFDFSKIRTYDYKCDQAYFDNDKVEKREFGKLKDGFFNFSYISMELNRNYFYEYKIQIKNDVYMFDKGEKFDQNSDVQILLNEKGDKVLVAMKKDGNHSIYRYGIDQKTFKIKREQEYKIKDILGLDKPAEFRFVPMQNDFITLVKNSSFNTISIFQNDQLITTFNATNDMQMENLDFITNEKQILSIYYLNPSNSQDLANNIFKLKQCTQAGEKKEWVWSNIQFSIFNKQECVCFPYAYFIYNHDQVLMKDLTQVNLKGYYYLNNYMGIDKNSRPLTIHCLTYNDKMSLNIPVIRKNYSQKEFHFRIHQLKTISQSQSPFKWTGFIRYRVYNFNQNFLSVFQSWAQSITNEQGLLHQDLRIFHRNNSLYIEKWEKNKCIQRIIGNYYTEPHEPTQRMISGNPAFTLYTKERAMAFILYQQNDNILIYTKEARYSFNIEDLITLDSIWDFSHDDPTNPIQDIIIDPFVKNKINLYIIFQNATMKRFVSSIPSAENGENLRFEEHPFVYNVDILHQKAGSAGQQSSGDKGSSSQTSKKINLSEQPRLVDVFIANNILYSQQGCLDLNAELIENKQQVGIKVNSQLKNINTINKLAFSLHEAKLVAIHKKEFDEYGGTNDDDTKIIVTPLINSRVAPQFYQRGFKHPVAPIVDKKRGITSVFTLNTKPIFMKHYYYDYEQNDCMYQDYTHTTFRYKSFKFNYNVTPGLLIKHFNGLEQIINIKEKFIDISRIQVSKNGEYVVIMGIMEGKIQDMEYNIKEVNRWEYHNGLFLYQVTSTSVTLTKTFLFAEKDVSKYSKQVLDKLLKPLPKNAEYIEPELEHISQIGEYDETCDIWEYNISQIPPKYENTIDFKQHDEEYVDKLKKEREEKRLLAIKQRNQNARSFMQRYTEKNNDEDEEEILARLDTEEKEERKRNQTEELKKQGLIEDAEPLPEITRLTNIIERYPGFDIPYKAEYETEVQNYLAHQHGIRAVREFDNTENSLTDIQQFFKSSVAPPDGSGRRFSPSKQNASLIKPAEEEQKQDENGEEPEGIKFEYEQHTIIPYSQEEIEKIQFMHSNMHLQVNENGDVFLLNRVHNKVYHFQKKPYSGEYQCHKHKFDTDFDIWYVDSSNGDLMVWNNKRVQVINPYEGVLFDNRKYEAEGVSKEKVAGDNYAYVINDVVITGKKLIIKIEDDDTYYVKIFDYMTKNTLYYQETSNCLISGDKRFIWIVDEHQVFDIMDGLSTFFFWPGDQINTTGFLDQDYFNVSEDRTILYNHCHMHLAFNLISYRINNSLFQALQNRDQAYSANESYFKIPNMFPYLCYKICDYRSILECIFQEEYDKMPKEDFVDPEYKEDDDDEYDEEDGENKEEAKDSKSPEDLKSEEIANRQQWIHKQTQSLLHFLTTCYNPEKNDPTQVSLFFFTFYFKNNSLSDRDLKSRNQLGLQNIFQKLFSHTDKRIDLIEDILQYVVSSNVAITQVGINSCFTKFLENANSSKAFRQYLENITCQTTKMKEIETSQIQSREEGFIAEAHDSPIIDDRFITKTRQIRESKKDVEVHYINLGNLLSINGEEIMTLLSDKKFLSLMDIPFIKYFVMYQWLNVKKKIQNKLLYPFFALLILYTLYAVYFVNYSTLSEASDNTGFFGWVKLIFNYSNIALLSGVLLYFLFIEAKQCIRDPGDYFTSFWNLSDLINYLLCLAVLILDQFDKHRYVIRPTSAICLIILWIRMFYFLRVFETTARLIRMIMEIVNDMKNFLVVLFIGVLGFTGGLFILQQGLTTTEEDGKVVQNMFVGADAFQAFIYTYRMALGDFQLDNFNDYEAQGLTFEYYLIWIIFIFGSLFLVIVLLNLLIAIMGDTFGRVLESIHNMVIREKVLLISENEALFDRGQLFGNAQFLIIITEKQLEGDSGENWDGQITMLRRTLVDKVTSLEKELVAQIDESQRELKKRFADQEDKSKKLSSSSEQKIQGHLKGEIDTALTKINEVHTSLQTQINKVSTQMTQNDSMRQLKLLQDQIEFMKSEQQKTTQNLYKALNIVPKKEGEDEE